MAGLKPIRKENARAPRQAQREAALQEMDLLAEQIAHSWRSPQSAVELIEEQRR